MQLPSVALVLVSVWSSGVAGAQDAPAAALDYPALLARLVEPAWLCAAPLAGERCVQYSSYDRRSEKGAGSFDDWYANDDRGKYLRVEERDGRKEFVMVDARGPGVVARIWSANAKGELFFDVDGVRVWTVDFARLCSGELPGVPAPLAGVRARGHNCYLPIPFAERLVVSASAGDLYYQVNVLSPGEGVSVPSFTPALLADHAAAITAAATRLASGSPPGAMFSSQWHAPQSIPRGMVVTSFSVTVDRRPPDADLGEVLRRVLLVVRCGRRETIRVPVLDFFVGGSRWAPWRSYLLGILEDGEGYCELPMPMPDGGSIALEVEGDLEGVELGLRGGMMSLAEYRAGAAALAGDARPLCLHAAFHSRKDFASKPFHDHLVLDTTGPGRFVGCSLLVKNPHRGWWGEGDEKFFVDGETFPSTFGTGTEDYFGYAWCDTAVFSAPQHAQPQCDGPGNRGHTADVRFHVLDAVPFHQSFRFDLEAWHWVDGLQMDYASVAYWYAPAGSDGGLPPLPAAAERALDRLPPPQVMVVDGAIEGEALRVVSCTGGRHEAQGMEFKEAEFSGDAQRWWMDGQIGDELVLAVPVPAAGRYRVRAAFCMADDYGVVQCVLAGEELGQPIDLYATAVRSSGALELGVVDLQPGDAQLRLRLVGKNPAAKPRHMVGLDYLLLEQVR